MIPMTLSRDMHESALRMVIYMTRAIFVILSFQRAIFGVFPRKKSVAEKIKYVIGRLCVGPKVHA